MPLLLRRRTEATDVAFDYFIKLGFLMHKGLVGSSGSRGQIRLREMEEPRVYGGVEGKC